MINQTRICLALLMAAFTGANLAAAGSGNDSTTTLNWQPKTKDIHGLSASEITGKLGSNTQAHLLVDGTIENTADLKALLLNLRKLDQDEALTGTYLLHVVKWTTPDHKETKFNNWYLYDGAAPGRSPYLSLSEAEWLERKSIPGRQNLFLVYLQIPSDDQTKEESALLYNGALTYAIAITKQQSQFNKDLASLVSIVKPEASFLIQDVMPLRDGYAASFPFKTGFEVCSISITPANFIPEKKATGNNVASATPTDKKPAEEKTVSPGVSYVDEPPNWRGLSFAVPVASYKDVTFDQTAGTLTPKTVSRQNIYACLDLYCPPLEPSLVTKSYLPHPFIGLPLTGKVLQHPMAGIALGHFGVELFYSGVYDMENRDSSGAKHPVWKSTYGVKISIDAGKAAISKMAGK